MSTETTGTEKAKREPRGLKYLRGRAKRNRAFDLIMNTLNHFSPDDQDRVLKEVMEELDEQREEACTTREPLPAPANRGWEGSGPNDPVV